MSAEGVDDRDVTISAQKWEADRRGLGAFKSAKFSAPKRRNKQSTASSPGSASDSDAPAQRDDSEEASVGQSTYNDKPVSLLESPADALARLAAEVMDLDGHDDGGLGSPAANVVAGSAGLQSGRSDLSRSNRDTSVSPRQQQKADDADDISSPPVSNSDGTPRWQAVGERPIEHLLHAVQRNAAHRLLRAIDGDEAAADEQEDDDDEDGGYDDDGADEDSDGGDAPGGRSGSRRSGAAGAGGAGRSGTAAAGQSGNGEFSYSGRFGSTTEPAALGSSPSAVRPQLRGVGSGEDGQTPAGDQDDGSAIGSATDLDGFVHADVATDGGSVTDLPSPGLPAGNRAGALGLAHPELQIALIKIKAAEDRIKAREASLAQREAAVAQLDARQRMVHQLRQQLDARDKDIKRREAHLAAREGRFDNELRMASASERSRLAKLIEEGETLVQRLKVELPQREADVEARALQLKAELAAREAEVEPRLVAVALRESSAAADHAIMMKALEAKETELVAAMITARDIIATTRAVGSHARSPRQPPAVPAHGTGSAAVPSTPASSTTGAGGGGASKGTGAGAGQGHESLFSAHAEVGVPGPVPGLGAAQAAITVEGLKQQQQGQEAGDASASTTNAGDGPSTPTSSRGPAPDPSIDPLAWLTDRIAHHSAALAASRKASEVETEKARTAAATRSVRRPAPGLPGSISLGASMPGSLAGSLSASAAAGLVGGSSLNGGLLSPGTRRSNISVGGLGSPLSARRAGGFPGGPGGISASVGSPGYGGMPSVGGPYSGASAYGYGGVPILGLGSPGYGPSAYGQQGGYGYGPSAYAGAGAGGFHSMAAAAASAVSVPAVGGAALAGLRSPAPQASSSSSSSLAAGSGAYPARSFGASGYLAEQLAGADVGLTAGSSSSADDEAGADKPSVALSAGSTHVHGVASHERAALLPGNASASSEGLGTVGLGSTLDGAHTLRASAGAVVGHVDGSSSGPSALGSSGHGTGSSSMGTSMSSTVGAAAFLQAVSRSSTGPQAVGSKDVDPEEPPRWYPPSLRPRSDLYKLA